MRCPPLLLLVAALLLVLLASSAASAEWAPADARAEVTQQVGRFAVIVYDLAHRAGLTYVGVARGETERQQAAVLLPGGGGGTVYYRLVVAAAKPDGSRAHYECLVSGVIGSGLDTWKLRWFRKM